MNELVYLHHNVNIPNWFDAFISRLKDERAHPDVMRSDGLICFCGKQGSGKTLSACFYVKALMERYPNLVCVSNVKLNYDVFDESRVRMYSGINDLTDFENGTDGVVYFLDEIQLEFNSLESKQANMPIFEFVCQQRKARKMVVGTTQVFGRLQKPFREQFKYAICCRNLIGSLFAQDVYAAENVAYEDDIKTELTHKCTRFYFAGNEDFQMYDTYEMIKRVRGAFHGDE